MKITKAAVAAAKNVIAFPLTRERCEKDELAFLPAALEIVELRRHHLVARSARPSSHSLF